MIQKIDHIGIAVHSIDEQIPYYRDVLGFEHIGNEEVAEQKVKVAMFRVGEVCIELLEATASDSPIAIFLSKKGQGIHHIAYATDNIKNDLQIAKEHDIRLLNETPLSGAHDKQIAFIHPKSTFGVLTEFCMAKEKNND